MDSVVLGPGEPVSPVADRDRQPVPVRERDLRGRDRGLRDRSEDYAVRGRDPVIKRAKDSYRAED